MPQIKFTSALKRFFPDLRPVELEGANVQEVVNALDTSFPGLKDYIVDDQGRLRKHVNIFVGNQLIKDKETLQDALSREDEVFIMQALSGG